VGGLECIRDDELSLQCSSEEVVVQRMTSEVAMDHLERAERRHI
jgi:hypothetical protein